jgi:integrase
MRSLLNDRTGSPGWGFSRRRCRARDGRQVVAIDNEAVELSATLLVQLREYWRVFRPYEWLFPGREPTVPLGVTSAQKSYTAAKRKVGVDKLGGIHGLRHAYATHQLAAGMPLIKLQHQLGHKDIRTTMRYLHWIPNYQGGNDGTDLIADLERAHERRG